MISSYPVALLQLQRQIYLRVHHCAFSINCGMGHCMREGSNTASCNFGVGQNIWTTQHGSQQLPWHC